MSNMRYTFFLPKQTQDRLLLRLNNLQAAYSDYAFEYKEYNNRSKNRDKYDDKGMKIAGMTGELLEIDRDLYNNILTQLHLRQKQAFEALYEVRRTERRIPVRGIVVGKGVPSPFDSGLCLHPQFGFPYIPATSWQGVMRNLFIVHYFERDEEKALKDEGFLTIFGSTDQRGKIDILDALPESFGFENLHIEINNNHNSKYYLEDKEPPKNFKAELSIHNYHIIKNLAYVFRLGCYTEADNAEIKSGKCKGKKPIDVVIAHLNWLFQYAGIGARTKIGLGVFSEDSFNSRTAEF